MLRDEPRKRNSRPPVPADKLTRDQFIEEVISVLQLQGGRAEKDEVITEVYRRNRKLFDTPYYQEGTGRRRTRWQHHPYRFFRRPRLSPARSQAAAWGVSSTSLSRGIAEA